MLHSRTLSSDIGEGRRETGRESRIAGFPQPKESRNSDDSSITPSLGRRVSFGDVVLSMAFAVLSGLAIYSIVFAQAQTQALLTRLDQIEHMLEKGGKSLVKTVGKNATDQEEPTRSGTKSTAGQTGSTVEPKDASGMAAQKSK